MKLLMTEQTIGREQADDIIAKFNERSRSGQVLLLHSGIRYHETLTRWHLAIAAGAGALIGCGLHMLVSR